MMRILAESSSEIWSFEISLWLLSPIALTCSLMFLAGILTAEKYTPARLFSVLFHPKLLTKKGRYQHIGFRVSVLPILILLAFSGIRFLDFPVLESRELVRSNSPDGSKSLVVSERTRFPMDELFDPTLSVRFLVDKKSGALLTERTIHLETSDLIEAPDIVWEKEIVKIRGFDDQEQDRIVSISLNH